ncbi:lysosomal-trafficking regulator [Schistocerca americana]|uniref:lysosomal-trafficking regulator n=1 Tax=Schistocerca americana TaxID=7009 RepID=UPI001F4FD807|nr:lysosomal-trafficking regulator [Schistocerca americana]
MTVPKLQQLWEYFIQAEHRSYEKSAWLDVFLSEFLVQVKEGKDANEIISCCSGSGSSPTGVAALIGCELLTEVHALCPPHSEDLQPLARLLLCGWGWRALAALHHLDCSSLSCGRELCALLVSLFPVGLEAAPRSLVINEECNPFVQLWKPRPPMDRPLIDVVRSRGLGSDGHSVTRSATSAPAAASGSSSESGGERAEPLSVIRIRLNPMDFEYFTSVVRSDDDGTGLVAASSSSNSTMLSGNQQIIPDPDALRREPRIQECVQTTLSGYELSLLVLDLLSRLAPRAHSTALSAANMCAHRLCGPGLVAAAAWAELGESRQWEVRARLVAVVAACLPALLVPAVLPATLRSGLLPILIKVLEDVVHRTSAAIKQTEDKGNDDESASVCGSFATVASPLTKEDAMKAQNVVYGISLAVLVFVRGILVTHRGGGTDRLHDALELLGLFLQGRGARLIESAISIVVAVPFVENCVSVSRASRLVDSVARLVSTLKRTQLELVQQATRRSRRTSAPAPGAAVVISTNSTPTHHHAPDPLDASYCRVSAVFTVLVHLLSVPAVRERVLRAMRHCGTCCCFQPRTLVSALVGILEQAGGNKRVRRLTFALLERSLYRELGAVVTERNKSCSVCSRWSSSSSSSSSSDLLFVADGYISGEGVGRWSCVELFRPLLEADTHNCQLSQALAAHLIQQMPRFTPYVKLQLLLHVFLPAFVNIKQRFLEHRREADKILLGSCLSALLVLLGCSEELSQEFSRKKGIDHIRDLISESPFVHICCSLLEVTATVDIWHISCEAEGDKHLDVVEHLKRLPNIELLHHCAEDTAKKLLVLLSAADSLAEVDAVLGDCTVFWHSVVDLAAYSPAYRQLLKLTCVPDSKNFLVSLLAAGAKSETMNYNNPSLIELLEVVLALNILSAPDVSDVVEILKEQLSQSASTEDENRYLWLCKLVMDSSVAESCSHHIMPPHRKTKMLSEEEADDDGESAGASSSYVTADEGYEADVEIPLQPVGSACAIDDPRCSRRYEVVCARSHNSEHHRRSPRLIEPQLCKLAVDILIRLPEEQQKSKEAVEVLKQLATLCRDCAENCARLAKIGMVSTLLEGFGLSLRRRDATLIDLQKVVLELVMLLARQSISPNELALYISFFKGDDPPLDLLLSPLVSLANETRPQPDHIIRFPCGEDTNVATPPPVPDQGGILVEGNYMSLVYNFSQQHTLAGAKTAWSACALSLPIGAELGWSMWLHGYSAAMWLRLDEPVVSTSPACPCSPASTFRQRPRAKSVASIPDNCWQHRDSLSQQRDRGHDEKTSLLHLISVGCECLLLELWTDTSNGSVLVLLTRPDNRGSEVISQATVENCLSPGSWQHLAMNVKDYMQRRMNVIEVELIVDGCDRHECLLSFSGLLVRKPRSSAVLIGHRKFQQSSSSGSWIFAGLQLFRCAVFSREKATYLVGLGPGRVSLADCDVGCTAPNFTHLFGPKSLGSDIDWDSILQAQAGNLKDLQDSVLMIFSAQNPDVVSLFPQFATGVGGPLFQVQPSFRSVPIEQRASQQVPICMAPMLLASKLDKIQHHSLLAAATLLGGVPVFLFLLARVVELTLVEEVQAQALLLFLRVAQGDCELFTQFVGQESYKLLLKILRSSRCSAGPYLLKAVLDACCDKPVLGYTSAANGPTRVTVLANTDAVVVNSFVLRAVAGAWAAWGPAGALGLLLRALHVLLRDDHPYREFNAAQMNRTHIVDSLLLFCKEQFLQEKPEIDMEPGICCSLVELVRSLMGAPPEFSHIVSVADFLLLAHPARHTYISHGRNNYYFVLDENSSSPLSGSLTEWRWRKKEMSLLARAIDPLKLNKALTNLQIKQLTGSVDSNRVIENGDIANTETSTSRRLSLVSNSLMACAEDAVQLLEQASNPAQVVETVKEKFVTETEERAEKMNNGANEHVSSDSHNLVMEGLLLLLKDVLLVLPDNMAPQVLNHVVRADTLLVIANHPDVRVRTAVVKVLSAYLQRASSDEVSRFCKMRGYQLLACQLAQWPASWELAEAAVALGTLCPLPLEEQAAALDLGASAAELQSSRPLAALPPLLALLPRCCRTDVALADTLLAYLSQLVLKVMQVSTARLLQDLGVVECLCRCLQAIPPPKLQSTPPSERPAFGSPNPEVLVGDIHLILGSIVTRSILLPGHQNSTQVLSDVLHQLGYLWEHLGSRRCRDAQFSVLESVVNVLLEKLNLAQPVGTLFQSGLANGYKENDAISTSSSSSSNNSVFSVSLTKEIGRSDLGDRFRNVISRAVEIICSTGRSAEQPQIPSRSQGMHHQLGHIFQQAPASVRSIEKEGRHAPTEAERAFRRRLLAALLSLVVERAAPSVVRDAARLRAAQLACWLLAPGQAARDRSHVVRLLLCQEPMRTREIVAALINAHQAAEAKLTAFLWDLARAEVATSIERHAAEELLARLAQWGLTAGPAPLDSWLSELAASQGEAIGARETSLRNSQSAVYRSVYRMEGLVRHLTETAMDVTAHVVGAQSAERKSFMEHIKARFSEDVRVRSHWLRLRQALTHERAVWYFPKSYPRSWQLDPTEGPARVRNRMQRCHLGMDRRYFLPAVQRQMRDELEGEPLAYLLERDTSQQQPRVSTVMIERLHTNEKIRHMTTARIVTPAREVPGEVLIGESCMYFVADSDCSSALSEWQLSPDEVDLSSTAWNFEDVCEIHNRRYQLQERALEIFLLNGRTYLVAFQSSKERDAFANELAQCRLPNRLAADSLSDAVHLWREGLLTNWEYLSQLNKMAGRSYNDLMQYPVMPFVLADYTSNVLDLKSPRSYRDFRKPMAVQEKKNEQHYISNYNYIKQELSAGSRHISVHQEPYHYGSHYSNSGTVLHFLVRLPPFTRMFLTYQDNNFDIPDRTFHSLHTTWRLTSSDSTTDVKEMVPEFFYLPEFLLNSEGFNLGVRQSGERVHNVQLPPWAGGDARKFILIHRQALESDFARENLPHWIDLVFGYKQTGKAAVEAINVFHPATYYGFDAESIRDPLERAAWETMVRTYGQTPRQLFRSPHQMAAQTLTSKRLSTTSRLPMDGLVRGLQWGHYVGSPAEPEPSEVWQRRHRVPVGHLIPLATGDVYGLAPHTCLLLSYTKDRGLGVVSGTSVHGAALLSWGHPDGIVRAKVKKEQPPWPVISTSAIDPVCICSSAPDVPQLWLGHTSGRIQVLRFRLEGSLEFRPEPSVLLGHTAALTDIVLCRSFSIAVSAGYDGSAIIWDLNSLSYVRSVAVSEPVKLATVSRTLGDILLVTDSELLLFSVNAAPAGRASPPSLTTAVCFSGAPEGISINAVASGHADGVIRLWSSWDLSPLKEISCNALLSQPIISITYSHDAQHMYASGANGIVVIWEGMSSKGPSHMPKFLDLTSL